MSGAGWAEAAIGLTGWLRGRFEGIDVVRPRDRVVSAGDTPRYPNFRFQVADVYNRHYNPVGHFAASEYRFPFEDESFAFVVLTSVFTHLLPADRDNYISEIARVLRPTGRCFATFFLLNDEARSSMQPGRGSVDFRFERPGYWTSNERIPEAAVAFEEADVAGRFEQDGLRIRALQYGVWSGRADGTGWQDMSSPSETASRALRDDRLSTRHLLQPCDHDEDRDEAEGREEVRIRGAGEEDASDHTDDDPGGADVGAPDRRARRRHAS